MGDRSQNSGVRRELAAGALRACCCAGFAKFDDGRTGYKDRLSVAVLKFHVGREGVVLGLRKQVLDAFETDVGINRHSLAPIAAMNIVAPVDVHRFARGLG